MSKIRYKPRLKIGISKTHKFLLTSKNISKLKKLKWRVSLRQEHFIEGFIRNDVLNISNLIFDQRKKHKQGTMSNRRFFSFFATFKRGDLKDLLVRLFKKKKLNQKSFSTFIGLRLDNLLIEANFVSTPFQARWLVAKGFVEVNGVIIRTCGYRLESGDLVRLKFFEKNIKENKVFLFSKNTFSFPKPNLEICYSSFSVIVQKTLAYPNAIFPFFFDVEELKNFNRTLIN